MWGVKMCQCMYTLADRRVWAQCIHLIFGARRLSEENWHWWEQTGWRQRLSSQRPHHYGWNPFDHPSLALTLSLLLLTCLSTSLLLFSTVQKQMSGRHHGTWYTHTHLFVFWVFSISLTRSTPPSLPLSYPPNHMHAHTHTLPFCVPHVIPLSWLDWSWRNSCWSTSINTSFDHLVAVVSLSVVSSELKCSELKD